MGIGYTPRKGEAKKSSAQVAAEIARQIFYGPPEEVKRRIREANDIANRCSSILMQEEHERERRKYVNTKAYIG